MKSLEDEIERLKVGRVALKQATLSVVRRFGKQGRPEVSEGDRPTSTPVASALAEAELGTVLDATADSSAPQPLAESESSVETTAPAGSLTQDNMTSDPVETLIMLKGITDRGYPDINTESFEFFSQLVSTAQRILCIQPTKKLAALAQAFACRGIDVTCAGCADTLLPSLEAAKVQVLSEGWLSLITETYQSSLADFDVVLLNGHLPENDARNLSYRLAPDTKLVVHDYELTAEEVKTSVVSGSGNSSMALGSPDATYNNFRLYKAPPAHLIDPLHPLPDSHPRQQWPWNYPVAPIPATYPSGKPLPKISVITVTFNQGPYLEETIRSVLMQGYPNLEYIVIDGCSTDNTSAILERYRDELTHCIVEPDNGQSDALNKGFRLATGDILAWLNSDDCYLPQALFRTAIAFENSDVDMVVGGCQLRHDFSPVPFQTHHSIFPLGEPVSLPLGRLLDLENCWKQGEFFYQPEVFWTKELWEKSGAHVNEQLFYSMDYELWLRMAQNEAKILHIPDPIALYRMHEAQKTYGDALPYYPELEQVAERFR
ncbi:MAG: glycosyltransferase family 2 protein [Cyanobacteria bacterium J06638_22]